MKFSSRSRCFLSFCLLCINLAGFLTQVHAQAEKPGREMHSLVDLYLKHPVKKANKPPYRLLTAGNQITIRSTTDIRTVMAWNAGGTRILERRIGAAQFSFRVASAQKIVFVRIQLENGKTFSEKVGLN